MWYGLLRYGTVALALIGWLFYQFFKKKKTFAELQPDILTVVALFAVWVFIYYEFIR